MRIIAVVPITELAIHINGLVSSGDDPFDGDVFSFWDTTGAVLVQAVGRAAVHPQLRGIDFPIEDDLVGGVGKTKVGGIGLGDNGDFDGWPISLPRVKMILPCWIVAGLSFKAG